MHILLIIAILHTFYIFDLFKHKHYNMANTYVRLSGYICDYLVFKFQSNPVDIPYTHHLYTIMEKYMFPNIEVRKVYSHDGKKQLLPTSIPEAAWNKKLATDGGGDYAFVPSEEDRSNYVSIKLPDKLYLGKELVQVNDTWQFSGAGINIFRQRVKRDFWSDLEQFISDYFRSCQYMGLPRNRDAAIEQFMAHCKIRTEFLETIIRNELRTRNSTEKACAFKRQMLSI